MDAKRVKRIIGAAVFLASLAVYVITLAPTVVFWDVGEFIAAAKMMQVPHPPGAPLFLLVTRVAMMFPVAADMAVRAHLVSALLSAFSVLFLYLVIVRVILQFRSAPASVVEMAEVYGAAVIGAFALAFSSSFWANGIEAEVYAASMFFLSAILWLALRWLDHAEAEGNEKYFLLISYLIGLSLGVHLLALLAIFPVMMIIYYRKFTVTAKSFSLLVIASVVAFSIVYPGIVKYVPGMMDGSFMDMKSQLIAFVPWLIIAAVVYFAYTTYVDKKKTLHVILMSVLLIFLGYTTYTTVLIRSNANPPMNENNPNTLDRLTSYLAREQYGQQGQWPRRNSQEAHQQEMYTKYTGEWDYLFRYQLDHMFFRYLEWNFIGEAGDYQDAGVSWTKTFGIPFLIGLLGCYYLFRKDPKLGLVFLAMFLILGPLLALYQNQQEPQPRERDYFYVGAFYVFALWIAMGILAIIEYVRRFVTSSGAAPSITMAVVGAGLVLVPVRLAQVNWHEHDREGNYVAWDYSYNILQTCEKDAILFTNGDNDTFPLWYLQDVEGIRRDVRIVNLSLVNTPWYIQQMKDSAYFPEARPVPISLPDDAIANIAPTVWRTRTLDLPVTEEAIRRYGVRDTAVAKSKKITFTMRNTMTIQRTPVIRVQDILVRDIIFTNEWKRPIYFAVTVSPDSKIGLDDYLWFHGLAWRLEPRRVGREDFGIEKSVLEANLMQEPTEPSKGPQYGYRFRRVADPGVYFDENTSRLMLNYRSAFMRLALYYSNADADTARAIATLNRMEELIPRSKVPMGWELLSDLGTFYARLGQTEAFNQIAGELEGTMKEMIASGRADASSPYNPYRVLFSIYEQKQDWPAMLELLTQLTQQYPNDPGLRQRIAEVQALVNRQAPKQPDSARIGG
jgi:hypothetical protein